MLELQALLGLAARGGISANTKRSSPRWRRRAEAEAKVAGRGEAAEEADGAGCTRATDARSRRRRSSRRARPARLERREDLGRHLGLGVVGVGGLGARSGVPRARKSRAAVADEYAARWRAILSRASSCARLTALVAVGRVLERELVVALGRSTACVHMYAAGIARCGSSPSRGE